MITRDNLTEVVKQLNTKTKYRICESDKEYCVLYLHVFNSGSYTTARLTDDFNRYKNVSNNGNAILYTQEVQDLINTEEYETEN